MKNDAVDTLSLESIVDDGSPDEDQSDEAEIPGPGVIATGARRRGQKFTMALLLAVLFHLGAAIGCWVIATRFLISLPVVLLAQGNSGSRGGLQQQHEFDPSATASLPPASAEESRFQGLDAPPLNQTGQDEVWAVHWPEPPPPTATNIGSDLTPIIGLATGDSATPTRQGHASRQHGPAAQPDGPLAAAPGSSADRASAPAGAHALSPPRGAGKQGNAGQPGVTSGFDSRGLPVPEYPVESVRAREEGVVLLEVEVGADGKPGRITVLASSSYSRLDKAAIAAMKRAIFVPATEDRTPVATYVKVPIQFTLHDR